MHPASAAPTPCHGGAPTGLSARAASRERVADVDRRAHEAKGLAQPAFDEANVDGSRKPDVNRIKVGGRRRRLGAEHDLGLFAAADGMRVLGNQTPQERVEASGGHPGFPTLERRSSARTSRSICQPVLAVMFMRGAHWTWASSLLDFAIQVAAAFVVEQIPLVEGEHQRAAGIDGELRMRASCSLSTSSTANEHDGDLGLFERRLRPQAGVEIRALRPVLTRRRMPAVSTKRQVRPPSSINSSTGSRVVPASVVDHHPLAARQLVEQR